MNISFLDKVENEQQVLEKFLYLAIFVSPGENPPDPRIIEEPELACYISQWGAPDDHALFAIDGDKVVGACWTRCFPESAPGYGTLSSAIPEISIAVLPDYRGKGIGSELMDRLLQKISNDYEAVSLSVSADNPAKRLYERLGFSTVSAKEGTLIMVKNLKSPSASNQ